MIKNVRFPKAIGHFWQKAYNINGLSNFGELTLNLQKMNNLLKNSVFISSLLMIHFGSLLAPKPDYRVPERASQFFGNDNNVLRYKVLIPIPSNITDKSDDQILELSKNRLKKISKAYLTRKMYNFLDYPLAPQTIDKLLVGQSVSANEIASYCSFGNDANDVFEAYLFARISDALETPTNEQKQAIIDLVKNDKGYETSSGFIYIPFNTPELQTFLKLFFPEQNPASPEDFAIFLHREAEVLKNQLQDTTVDSTQTLSKNQKEENIKLLNTVINRPVQWQRARNLNAGLIALAGFVALVSSFLFGKEKSSDKKLASRKKAWLRNILKFGGLAVVLGGLARLAYVYKTCPVTVR